MELKVSLQKILVQATLTPDEQMSRRNAFIQEDDMIEKKDSF